MPWASPSGEVWGGGVKGHSPPGNCEKKVIAVTVTKMCIPS